MKKLPPLIELRAFEAAARHLSFKDAAAELGVTPTAISHQIRLLERYCGRPLFRRRPRPLALTDAGARLFPVIRDGLEAFAAAISAVRDDADRQPLRVTTTNAFAGRWLLPRLERWRAIHPDVPIAVSGTDAIVDLRAGEADLAIRYAPKSPTRAIAVELFKDSYWPICSPRLFARGKRVRRPADLRGHTLIHVYWPPSFRSPPTWRRWLSAARSRWGEAMALEEMRQVNFSEELPAYEAVIAGQGIGICSDVLVAQELAAGTLIKALDLKLPGYGFYVVRIAAHPREKTIDAFSAWLQSVV
jgi:LysR family transcriptional regulator, glycine cleavage system transcriptional activator